MTCVGFARFRIIPYVDGFGVPVPKKNVKAYARIARKAGAIWKKCGALEYRECIGDVIRVKGPLPFPKLARLQAGETVFFSYIVYKSRAHRDRVNAKVMKDPVLMSMCGGASMPFDFRRRAYGGFKVLVET